MPLTTGDFPPEVQVAFFIYNYLSDRWEGMSGSYLGKDWSNIQFLFDLHQVDNPREIYFFAKLIEAEAVSFYSEEAEKKRKAEERKAKNSAGPGKSFTHNVQG